MFIFMYVFATLYTHTLGKKNGQMPIIITLRIQVPSQTYRFISALQLMISKPVSNMILSDRRRLLLLCVLRMIIPRFWAEKEEREESPL